VRALVPDAFTPHYDDDDRAYFVDVLASFLASPKFTRHELNEYVLPAVHSESSAAIQSAPTHALELAHALAFRNGLGYSLYADAHAAGTITAEDVRDLHARAVGNPGGVAVLGTGISTESLAKLLESAFSANKKASATPVPETRTAPATAYHGGAARVASAHGPQALFVGFGSTATASVPALHALAAHLNPAPALKWATSAAPLASAIPVGVSAYSVLLPYSDATLIGVVLEGTDGGALKEGAKAVVGAFKDAAAGKVGKEELARATARAKFQLAAGVEGREGYVGVFGPKVLSGEAASVQAALEGVQGVSGASLARVRATHLPCALIHADFLFVGCSGTRQEQAHLRRGWRFAHVAVCGRDRAQRMIGITIAGGGFGLGVDVPRSRILSSFCSRPSSLL
jgi:ubiquinol-cytochrome c reductase core subunit 2